MIAYADLASRTRRIWIIELTRIVCPGTKQHRIMHSRNPRRRYFSFFFFFLPLPFFSIFIPTRTRVQNCTRREKNSRMEIWKINYLKFSLFNFDYLNFLKNFSLWNSWIELNEKFIHFDIPRNSKNLNFGKIKKKSFQVQFYHMCVNIR